MKLTATGIAKIAAAVAGAVASAALGARTAHTEHATQIQQLVDKVDGIAVDVRLLKCAADFPGDCPGQAAKTKPQPSGHGP